MLLKEKEERETDEIERMEELEGLRIHKRLGKWLKKNY